MSIFGEKVDQKQIIERYFSDPERCIHLKKGEILLDQGQLNKRLFFVKKGKLAGFLPGRLTSEPIFEATEGSFAGVYSYFASHHQSYSQLVAKEDSTVFYNEGNPLDLPEDQAKELTGFLFNIVVLELRSRQRFAAKMADERQEVMNKLIKTEKLATLGQLSTGLAHELNNTIGSFSGNLRQLETDIEKLILIHRSEKMKAYYNKGLTEGQKISTKEARENRDLWPDKLKLSRQTIKILCKADIKPSAISSSAEANEAADLWSLGHVLHDMRTATEQANHVLRSVKDMGVANQKWSGQTSVKSTIEDALAILRNLTKRIDLAVNLDETSSIEGCHGELVQVWINLVKNAVESLLSQHSQHPKIEIKLTEAENYLQIQISDNGPGIPSEIIEKIYEPSFTTKVHGISLGLGIGLTIVERIVNEHHGRISVSSSPGDTTFSIILPKHKPIDHG